MLEVFNYLKARYVSEKAQGLVEYAILLAFVVVVGAIIVGSGNDTIANSVSTIFTKVQTILSGAASKAQ